MKEIEVIKREVVGAFLNRVMREGTRIQRLVIISPWVSEFKYRLKTDVGEFTLKTMVDRIENSQGNLYILTRKAKPRDPWHQEALDAFSNSARCKIKINENLHAKIYYAQTERESYAMLCSANFTSRSLDNDEAGILIRLTRNSEKLVRQIENIGMDYYRNGLNY